MSQSALTRREFAKFITFGTIGVALVGDAACAVARPLSPEWWLELHLDGTVRLLTTKVEMGQGSHSGLLTLMAEELDLEPAAIELVQVESDPRYGQIITGGSFTLVAWQERLRRAGATARHLLVQAAARRLGVAATELQTANGVVSHVATSRELLYRELIADAAALPVPPAAAVTLKPPGAWRYLGKPARMAHAAAIVDGSARYGADLRLPDMCFAVLARAPVINARLLTHEASDARTTAGFIGTFALRGNAWPDANHVRDAVAVVATNSWAAQQARAALRIEWQRPPGAHPDTVARFAALDREVDRPGHLSRAQGRPPVATANTRAVEATYRQPYLAHAPIEPPNATAGFVDGQLHVWTGTQRQTRLKDAIVTQCGLPAEKVVVHASLIGGSFGRRLEVDYGIEAAKLAIALQRPVQVLWTREDDLQFGLYRPGSVHRMRAVLEGSRWLSLEHRFAAESVFGQQEPQQIAPDGADWTLATPLVSMFYDVPHLKLEHRTAAAMSPCAWWRGTYWNNVTVAVECLIDELCEDTGLDPLAFRLAHLPTRKQEFAASGDSKVPFDPVRMRRVLEALATKCNWRTTTEAGRARGLACGIYDSPECHAAVVAEMTMVENRPVLVSATIAVDVGTAVNPNIVEAQAIGGFIMGASAALREQVTWRDGSVEQAGFHDYRVMRLADAPARIDVVIVPSDAGICGVGEIVTPAAMAAVSNAASRLLHRRVRSWPILADR